MSPQSTTTRDPPSLTALSLTNLKTIIDSELDFWIHWTTALQPLPTFSSLTANPENPCPEAKTGALIHILEILPYRYEALTHSSSSSSSSSSTSASETFSKRVVLSTDLSALLKSLKKKKKEEEERRKKKDPKVPAGEEEKGEEEKDDDELDDWFSHKLFKSKKFRQDVLGMEEEIQRREESRKETLKGLMVVCEELMILEREEGRGVVGRETVEALVEAMDSVGLDAGRGEGR